MRSRTWLVCAATAVALLAVMPLAGCSKPNPNPTPEATPVTPSPSTTATSSAASKAKAAATHQVVTITDKGFQPGTVTVKPGTRVVWTNTGQVGHDVTLGISGPSSGQIDPGKAASHVFDKKGTYDYHDSSNPALTGRVVVK